MQFTFSPSSLRSVWLLLLAGVLLWGQVANAQHIHADSSNSSHECVSCQQLSSAELAGSHEIVVLPLCIAEVTCSAIASSIITAAFKHLPIRGPPAV